MHEQALMRDLIARIVSVAEAEGASGVTRVTVRLGALSHFTPEHFREHYRDAAHGTIAEGAAVDATLDESTTDPNAAGRRARERRARGDGLMCLGSIDVLAEAWEDDGTRVGRLGCGKVVPLAFVPEARDGDHVLVHLGVPVEVLDPEAAAAKRSHCEAKEAARMSSTRATGIALAFVTALISGVAIFVNGHAVQALRRRDRLHDREERRRGRRCCSRSRLRCSAARAARSPQIRQACGSACSRSRVIGGSVPFVLFFEGLARAEATQAAFIQKTLVVWVAMLAVPLLHERLGWPHLAAIALLVAGQAWLVGDAGTVAFGSGEAMILAATLLWAVEVIVAKRLLVGPRLARLLGAARMALGTVVLLAWVAVSGRAARARLALGETSGAGSCSPA